MDSGKSSLYPSVLCRVKRTHIANQMKRVQRVEDSLAQSGARPQCGFHLLPQRTPRGKHSKANAFTQKRTHAAPPTPFSAFPCPFRPPSGSPHENAQARSELIKPDNRTTLENALMAITTHGGIGTQHPASRSVWRHAANSRRDRTQDIPRGTHDGREQTHDIPIESHDRHRTNTAPRESRPAPQTSPRAHNPLCRS